MKSSIHQNGREPITNKVTETHDRVVRKTTGSGNALKIQSGQKSSFVHSLWMTQEQMMGRTVAEFSCMLQKNQVTVGGLRVSEEMNHSVIMWTAPCCLLIVRLPVSGLSWCLWPNIAPVSTCGGLYIRRRSAGWGNTWRTGLERQVFQSVEEKPFLKTTAEFGMNF